MAVAAAEQSVDWDQVRDTLLGQRNQSVLPPWVKLPSLPLALMEFTQKAQKANIDAAELGQAIEKDAGLTCQLLRHVNSAAAGFQGQASTAQDAIVRMGVRGSALYLLTIGMNQVLKSSESKLVNFDGFWCANLERALFAREVAEFLGADSELAFAGAIVSDCLLPLMTNRATQTYVRFLSGQDKQPTPLTAFENQEFGWNHAEATACLLIGWNFPSDLVCCALLHHKGLEIFQNPQLKRTAAAAVAVAGLLPEQLRQDPHGLKALQKLQQAWPKFNLRALGEAVERRFAEIEPGVKNPFPLLRRLARVL